MKKLMSLLLAGLLLVTTAATAAAPYANNRAPLREKPFVKLPLGAIRAEGWLRDQLQRQADGLTGHLDSVYPEVMGPRNGWLGGDGDVWERGPYWIDGLLPLAYTHGDEDILHTIHDACPFPCLIPQHPLSLLEIIGILFTKCSKRTTLYRQTSEQVRSVFSHLPIFESQIPATVQVGTANSKGLSVMELDAKSPAAAAYMNLAKEVLAYA